MSAYETYQQLLAESPVAERRQIERAFEAGVIHAAETFKQLREVDAEARAACPSRFEDVFGRLMGR